MSQSYRYCNLKMWPEASSVLLHSPIVSHPAPDVHVSLVCKSFIFYPNTLHTWVDRRVLREQIFAVSMQDACNVTGDHAMNKRSMTLVLPSET